MKSRRPPPFTSSRELVLRAIAALPPAENSLDEARATAAARLELARAMHHLRRTKSGRHILSLPLPDPITTKVKGTMSTFNRWSISGDLPSEMTELSDGVSDDGAIDQQIIGACACDARGSQVGSGMRQHLRVSDGVAGGLQHLSVAGLGDLTVGGLGSLTVAGFPGYLFTQKNLSNPVMRRRLAAHIKGLSPKLRRRVMERLRSAASIASRSARVSGIRHVTPQIGWTGITVSGRRSSCPYANVAGALTP